MSVIGQLLLIIAALSALVKISAGSASDIYKVKGLDQFGAKGNNIFPFMQ